MPHIIIATDSWKGSLTSLQAGEAMAAAIHQSWPDIRITTLPISDGGEGFTHAMTHALGGRLIPITAHDPLLRPITTHYGLLPDGTAIIDVASIIGLTLLSPDERNPMTASSRGVGEAMAQIIGRGTRQLIIGLGGSATNDCGRGMLEALAGTPGLDRCHITIATDVDSPLCGPTGATQMYALQKGATPQMLPLLERRTLEYGQYLEQLTGRAIIDQPGAGAAGGIGAALMSLPHCERMSGIDLLLRLSHFDHLLHDATLVITGEGHIDRQTLQGKAPYRIALQANSHHVPCIAICGQADPDLIAAPSPWQAIIPVAPPHADPATMMQPDVARRNIELTIKDHLTPNSVFITETT